jgi:hypothetical protein
MLKYNSTNSHYIKVELYPITVILNFQLSEIFCQSQIKTKASTFKSNVVQSPKKFKTQINSTEIGP